MPSLGSLSFSPPAPSGGSSAQLQRRIALKKPSFSPLYGRNGLDCEMRPFEVLNAGILKKSLRAAGRSGATEGKGEGSSGDDENYGTDYIEEMFEDGKGVLRTQSEILDKILERKRLLSAVIDHTLSEAESDLLTNNEVGESSEDICKMMISEEIHRKHSCDSHSENSNSVNQIDASGPLYRERAQNSQFYEAMAGDLGLLREAGSAGAYPDTVSPSLSKLSSLNGIKPQVCRDCKETYVEDVNAKWDATHEEVVKDAPPLAGDNVMNIILVAAECAPWSKTGGLGDVAGALPKALARRGHRVMVVAPKYGNYSEPQNLGVYRTYKVEGQDMEVSYFHVYVDGVDFVFIDSPPFRHRENDIYGGNHMDVLKRMVLLCKAAVEVPWHVPCGGVCYGDGNLVFIANDWHTALLPVYLKAYYREHGQMMYTRCVLVIHNIAHQGRGPLEYFRYLDLPDHYIDLFKLHDPLGGEHLNIFAAGLKAADRLLTVSHGYAWEIKTSEGGWGLDRIINDNDWKFQGIVNGIDTRDWNPNLDVYLKSDGYSNYSLETLKIGKPRCKAALQRELGLPVRDDIPVVGFIGRLDHQKGVDLIGDAMHWIMAQDVQLIMLGTGQRNLEEMLRKFEREHYDKVRGIVEFSVKIAHRITAGADILLMPSRFEPCGLNQLYAMMYGTIPVVHAVGGLRDTVHQFDPYNDSGFGWTFDRAEASKLIDALGNAFNTYWNYKESWERLQRRGMMQDLSWDNAAQQYENVLVAAKYQW